MSTRPEVTIELLAPMPPLNKQWCAVCAMLYLGEISDDRPTQASIRKQVQAAQKAGEEEVNFVMPETWRRLRVAVTIAPTVHFPNYPLPTCWIHMQGMKPEGTKADFIQVNMNGGKKNGREVESSSDT